MALCTGCRKKECKSRKLINGKCYDCTPPVANFDVNFPRNPEGTLASVQFKDFVQWMNNDFLSNIDDNTWMQLVISVQNKKKTAGKFGFVGVLWLEGKTLKRKLY